MTSAPPYPGFFQVAYVTRDIVRAQALFAQTHGARSFLEMRDIRYAVGAGREAHCHVSLAYVGATEIELIQPIDGAVEIYVAGLPEEGGPLVRFHHLCRRFATRQEYQRQIEDFRALGKQFPIMGEAAGIGAYFYCDMRAELGHYVEGIVFDDDAAEWLASIPRF